MEKLSDLKLIDELLINLLLAERRSFDVIRSHDIIVDQALTRLQEAFESEEMPQITLSLANYFKERNKKAII